LPAASVPSIAFARDRHIELDRLLSLDDVPPKFLPSVEAGDGAHRDPAGGTLEHCEEHVAQRVAVKRDMGGAELAGFGRGLLQQGSEV
jgi:hypothetical protein